MAQYRKGPIVIEAVQLLWENWNEVCDLVGVGHLTDGKPEGKMGDHSEIHLLIPTLEGLMEATEGDWIIRGMAGECYPCKPDVFEQTYEPVNQEA